MNYQLDSDVLIYFFNQQEPWYNLVSSFLKQQEQIFISVLSIMELCAGLSKEQQQEYLPLLYDLFSITQLTNEIAERAGQIRYQYKQQDKRKPSPIDALIAATAIEHKYCLITNNVKDYTMPQLEIYRF